MNALRLTIALFFGLLAFISAQDLLINPDQTAADTACSITHYDVQTSDPPIFHPETSGFVTLDTLTLTVSFSRRYYLAHFNMSNANNDLCNAAFQVNNDLTTTCNVVVQANIPWADARAHCGITEDSPVVGDHLVFRGSVLVDLTESNLPAIRDRDLTRLTHSVFPFYIRFPTTVSTQSSVTVFADVALDAAIIRQFDVRTPDATTTASSSIRLFTSIQSPFYLASPVLASRSRNDFTIEPVTAATSALLVGEDCRNDLTDLICEQEWLIQFDATASPPVCDFTGTYAFSFTILCQTAIGTHCPLPFVAADNTNEASATVTLQITTENFCPVMFSDIPLTASLASFQDSALTISKTDFLSGDTVYFKVNVASTQATISSSSVSTVSISYGSPVTNTLITPASMNTNDVNAMQCEFSVVLDSNFPVPVDGSVPFTFVVVMNVVFLNTQTIHIIQKTIKPVTLVASTTNAIDATIDVNVSPAPASPATSSSSSSTLIYIIAGSCVGVILFATIAVIIRRRGVAAKKSAPSTEMAGASSAVTGATSVV